MKVTDLINKIVFQKYKVINYSLAGMCRIREDKRILLHSSNTNSTTVLKNKYKWIYCANSDCIIIIP